MDFQNGEVPGSRTSPVCMGGSAWSTPFSALYRNHHPCTHMQMEHLLLITENGELTNIFISEDKVNIFTDLESLGLGDCDAIKLFPNFSILRDVIPRAEIGVGCTTHYNRCTEPYKTGKQTSTTSRL